jgi:hypothetical protein
MFLMKIELVKTLPVWDRYFYFVEEREKVRVAKEIGAPRPWTDDEIIDTYRFCNMRRMDDRVSQWLLNNWYKPYFDHPNMLPAVALARFVNLPTSLKVLTHIVFDTSPQPIWRPNEIVNNLRRLRDGGNTIFNGAYMVRGNDGMDKIDCVVNYYVKAIRELENPVDRSSMQNTHTKLLEAFGMGSFMAGQIVADLRWAMKGRWGDRRIWAPIGPGSKRGMNRLYERGLGDTLTQTAFETNLAILIQRANDRLPTAITERMEAQDWQSTLCEYDKYIRALQGEGKPKQLYKRGLHDLE